MCGIAGVVGLDPRIASARVAEALRRLVHRGPDGDGCWVDEAVVLGMRRLAIIDLEHGDQPIWNEDRTIAVVCNGELYDYVERFRDLEARGHRMQSGSDVNVIPHLYEEEGRDAFRHVRGMFAAALWDRNRARLVLARDRVGKKPLFYAPVGRGLAFASELPALLALIDERPAYQPTAVADYLRLGFVPHPTTIYKDIFALPPGCVLEYEPAGVARVAPYWQPADAEPFHGSRADAVDELDRQLREAVSLRLRSDVPVGMFLSGGIDSGLVAAYAAQAGARDLLCFVVQVDDADLNEAPAARDTAGRLGLPVETIYVTVAPSEAIERVPLLFGQPFADSSAVPTYFVAKAASERRKVVLNGDGGDEVFAGYRRYWAGRAARALNRLGRPARGPLAAAGRWLGRHRPRRSPLGFFGRILRGLAYDDAERYLAWTNDLLGETDLARCFPELARGESTPDRLARLSGERPSTDGLRAFQRSDYRLILPDQLLVKMDIATMANSVEARSPFLDVPLAEFASSLPERWLLAFRETKPLLRELAGRVLAPDVARAPKRGFEVPVARWLAYDLRDAVGDLLLASSSRVAAFGNAARIHDFVRGKDDFAGNRAQAVWSLLMLELFLRGGP